MKWKQCSQEYNDLGILEEKKKISQTIQQREKKKKKQ